MKTAVIGSGLSGLTAAALLGKAGHSVTIYEQHETIGGVTNAMTSSQKVVNQILEKG